jgi:hypothetical protein
MACYRGSFGQSDVGKPVAHIYLDDRSPGWEDFMRLAVEAAVAYCWSRCHIAARQHARCAAAAAGE